MAYHKNNQFLHNHPNLEIMRNLDKGHVIVDREDWEEARRMYWEKTYKDIIPYYFQGGFVEYDVFRKAMYSKPQIKVFLTKEGKFRAKIKEDSLAIPYEVTIGGDSWENGKGRKYEESIMRKCAKLRNKVYQNINDLGLNHSS